MRRLYPCFADLAAGEVKESDLVDKFMKSTDVDGWNRSSYADAHALKHVLPSWMPRDAWAKISDEPASTRPVRACAPVLYPRTPLFSAIPYIPARCTMNRRASRPAYSAQTERPIPVRFYQG